MLLLSLEQYCKKGGCIVLAGGYHSLRLSVKTSSGNSPFDSHGVCTDSREKFLVIQISEISFRYLTC